MHPQCRPRSLDGEHGIGMDGAKENGVSPHGERYRWMFVFAIGGDLRFISHHDTLRLFRRALARADLPVRFSEGFNPHPRIMIPLPRPVGIASRAEALVVETERLIDPQDALQRLDRHTPEDIRMISVRRLRESERLVPEIVRYRLDLGGAPEPLSPSEGEGRVRGSEDGLPDAAAPTDLAARTRSIIESEVVQVQRAIPKTGLTKTVDIRPFLAELGVDPRRAGINFTLRMIAGGSAKPAEIASLLGCDAGSINHRIERLEVEWRQT